MPKSHNIVDIQNLAMHSRVHARIESTRMKKKNNERLSLRNPGGNRISLGNLVGLEFLVES
jgi:hypothetical protein